jgi:hypothetical protein
MPERGQRTNRGQNKQREEQELLFSAGDKVWARFQGGSQYFPGIIREVKAEEGVYQVVYTDGMMDKRTPNTVKRSLDGMHAALVMP